jgi:Acetyltransferase (GNAT) domain
MDSKNGANEFSVRAQAFANIHSEHISEKFAANIHTRVELLQQGDCTIPVTINSYEPNNAWVCSPKATYADYAAEEAERYLWAWLNRPNRWLFRQIQAWLERSDIDNVVTLNNWLLSTNIYPALSSVPLEAMIRSARERWPEHALWFRSLNQSLNSDWLAALTSKGFELIASRQIYLYHDMASLYAKHINLRRDIALLKKTGLQRVHDKEFSEPDYPRIARLYEQLYVEKYSTLNPCYNAEFIRSWHKAGLLQFDGFRNQHGELLAVIGIFRQGDTITAPIVGYDTALPQSLGLYRLVTACAYEAALQNQYCLNFSAGASYFKRLRGGAASIEYSAVYTAHLPRKTRRVIRALSVLTRRVGVPLMKRYQL